MTDDHHLSFWDPHLGESSREGDERDERQASLGQRPIWMMSTDQQKHHSVSFIGLLEQLFHDTPPSKHPELQALKDVIKKYRTIILPHAWD